MFYLNLAFSYFDFKGTRINIIIYMNKNDIYVSLNFGEKQKVFAKYPSKS